MAAFFAFLFFLAWLCSQSSCRWSISSLSDFPSQQMRDGGLQETDAGRTPPTETTINSERARSDKTRHTNRECGGEFSYISFLTSTLMDALLVWDLRLSFPSEGSMCERRCIRSNIGVLSPRPHDGTKLS